MRQSIYMNRYMTAKEAAQTLGVSLPTLYAYTSRGQLQSETVPGRPRESRYPREDVERLRERKETRRDPAKAAERGLHWGSPVLASGVTLIQDGRLYYRGRDVMKLAETATLEQTAELLWGGFGEGAALRLPKGFVARLRRQIRDPYARIQAALPVAAAMDSVAYDLRPSAVRQAGARILRLAAALIASEAVHGPVHVALARAWAPRRADAAEAIRAALVLAADHELNVSAFTARCAASAGASVYDVVAAALATLKGIRHGGESERVMALFEEIGSPGRARALIARRLRLGERVPGFGHPLYPDGDPRAAFLLRLASRGAKNEMRMVKSVWRAASGLLNEWPNLDFGLGALARAYGLPARAPLILFALGRMTGWIAHAMEQYATGELIRPRARYTGPAPQLTTQVEL